MLSKNKKDLHKNYRRSPKKKKKGLHKNFSSDLHKKTFSKKFFKRSRKLQQFRKYCCPRAEDRPIFEDLRPRGQDQGFDLRGQGQGLQNVSSRTSSRPRTSSRTPPLVTHTWRKGNFKSVFRINCTKTLINFIILYHRNYVQPNKKHSKRWVAVEKNQDQKGK